MPAENLKLEEKEANATEGNMMGTDKPPGLPHYGDTNC